MLSTLPPPPPPAPPRDALPTPLRLLPRLLGEGGRRLGAPPGYGGPEPRPPTWGAARACGRVGTDPQSSRLRVGECAVGCVVASAAPAAALRPRLGKLMLSAGGDNWPSGENSCPPREAGSGGGGGSGSGSGGCGGSGGSGSSGGSSGGSSRSRSRSRSGMAAAAADSEVAAAAAAAAATAAAGCGRGKGTAQPPDQYLAESPEYGVGSACSVIQGFMGE